MQQLGAEEAAAALRRRRRQAAAATTAAAVAATPAGEAMELEAEAAVPAVKLSVASFARRRDRGRRIRRSRSSSAVPVSLGKIGSGSCCFYGVYVLLGMCMLSVICLCINTLYIALPVFLPALSNGER